MSRPELISIPEGFTSHGGGDAPDIGNIRVVVLLRSGIRTTDYVSDFRWSHLGLAADIIAYRAFDAYPPEKLAATPAETGSPFAGEVSVCQEAAKVIENRREAYGSAKQNFDDIAALWDVAFGHKMTAMFTASDVAQAMRLVKEARLINDPTHRDSLVDICGYAECQNEVNGQNVDEIA